MFASAFRSLDLVASPETMLMPICASRKVRRCAAALAHASVATVAPYGPQWIPGDSDDIPVTFDQQVQKAVDCWNAGATVLHVHVREADGKGSKRLSPNRMDEAGTCAPPARSRTSSSIYRSRRSDMIGRSRGVRARGDGRVRPLAITQLSSLDGCNAAIPAPPPAPDRR
jgi:hypothetical protein